QHRSARRGHHVHLVEDRTNGVAVVDDRTIGLHLAHPAAYDGVPVINLISLAFLNRHFQTVHACSSVNLAAGGMRLDELELLYLLDVGTGVLWIRCVCRVRSIRGATEWSR